MSHPATTGRDTANAAAAAAGSQDPEANATKRHGRLAEVLSNEKSFNHRWVGSALGNRLGLHPARALLASLCGSIRRSLAPGRGGEAAAALRRDGVVVIRDALPAALVERARAEFTRALALHERRVPRPACNTRGFGAPISNAWGFDRYDGGSLNRFIRIDDDCPALREAFGDAGALCARLRPLVGTRVALDRFTLYQLVHGDERERPDLQRRTHCDTFHETFKLWYFFDEVTPEHGPLMYARGSHRNTRARLAWERRCVVERRSRSSAFRIDDKQLRELGWAAPEPVLAPGNSIVLANTRGFHCRGMAPAGTERAGIHANLRPLAFSVLPM
jgi:hypothetical protein